MKTQGRIEKHEFCTHKNTFHLAL